MAEMEVAEAPEENVDIAFRAIGGGVSLLPPGAKASSDYHPARALAVSNHFGLTFFAAPAGFGVVRTADVLELSSGPKPASVSEKCLASVELEKVSILELSKDELTLAVCAGFAIRFYRVPSLALKADTRPFEIRNIGNDALIKDFQWCGLDQDKNKYLVLTSTGKLLVGKIGEEPTSMKDNVSAACWSQFGKQIMYATSTKLTIASSDFAKSFVINLPVEFPGCEEGLETHVDALRWISPQSIVISYVQSEDDEEIACPLLVLSASHGQQLDEACTECSALAVTRRFPAIESTIIPPMNSPYMLVQNLEPWKIVLTTCRRSIDAHVGLLGWRSEGVCSLDLSDDLWRADIPMFDSSSDNALTGLAIDRTSLLKQPDPRNPEKLLPPSPVMLCTSLDSRLLLYSVLRLDGESWYSPGLITIPSSLEEWASKSPDPKVDAEKKTVTPAPATVVRVEPKVTKTVTTMNGIQPRTFSASKTVNEQLRKTQLDLNQKEKEPALPQGGASKIPVQSQPLSFKREDAPSHEVEKRSSRSQGVSEIEAGFLAEMDKVKKIADDIDGFMHIIEIDSLGSGLTRSGVDKLESEIIAVSARCRSFKQKLQEHCEFVDELRDQSLDVDAWRIYVESRVEQASDSRYQDLWVHRKLHPEMDLKRKHVINADETLKRQISDLESHLHTLEISRRQNMSSKQRSTAGDFQSVQNLYSTVNFQMEAADKLCVHLADLMESMNISSSVTSLRPRKMQSSLLQTKPPQTKTESVFSTPSKSILSDDFAPAESTRRRRDSLDSGIGATKTTIKRMVGVVNNRKAKLLESTSNALQTMKPQSTLKQPSVTEEKILVLAPAATSLDTTRPSFSSRTDIVSQSSSPPFGDGGLRSQPLPPSSNASALKVPDISRASTNVIRPASAFISPASITKTSSITTQATPPSAWLPSLELKAAPAVVSFGPLEVKATSSTVQATPAASTSLELKRTTSPTSSDLKATPITSSPTFSVSTRLGAPLPSLFQQLESKPSTSEQAQSQPKISAAPIAATCSVSSGSSQLVVSSSTSATLLPAAPRTTSLVKPAAFSFPVSSSPATALSFAPSSAATSTLSMMSATTKVPSSGYSSSPPQSTSQLTVSSSPPSTTSKPDIFASPFPNVPAASGPSPVSSPFPALLQSQQQQTTQAVRPPPDEDDMDEEAPSSAFSGFGNLGLGSALPSAPTGNPFGVTPSPQATPFGGLTAPPPGQLFRPAAFSLSSPGTGFTSSPEGGAFSNRPAAAPSGFGQAASSGFGQPAGSALGSALGAFGQTRQVGFGGPVSGAAGFASASPGGGFASAATGGGFASATSGAGFAAAASGGGFAGAATGSGFQSLGQNISSGGFGGFAGSNAATPGFGSVQPPGGFLPGAAQPPNNPLFTAMRK